jgi:regulator of protease activity HflC (stomatin/prohibitin superfamily)
MLNRHHRNSLFYRYFILRPTMKSIFKLSAIVLAVATLQACTRIESGEVGVRIDASKQISGSELNPGSWNQTLIGDVLTFPVRDIVVNLDNKTPLTADNSALSDFDMTVVYGITPSSVSELYTTKSKSFHLFDAKSNDTLLMANYITTLVNNASYKTVREYKALEVADNRAKIEAQIRTLVTEQLKAEKLDTSMSISVVQVRNVQPNPEILKSATEYVKSQNEIKIKENEVKLAKLEAERMAALAQNSGQSIAYMQAQANMKIADGILAGKVQTILIPHGMTMFNMPAK